MALERILTATRLPVLVLDPNSDFVNLGSAVPEADPQGARAITERDVVVMRPQSTEHPLRIRFTDLDARARAAVLRLDPTVDRLEHNALITMSEQMADLKADHIVPFLRAHDTAEATMLAQRIENLGLLGWRTVWSDHMKSVTDVIDTRPAATVLDLGSYDLHEEQLAVALGALNNLWERRAERRPILIVVDEAHNLCPPDPQTPVGSPSATVWSRSPRRGASTASGSSSRPSDPPRSTRAWCPNATTSP